MSSPSKARPKPKEAAKKRSLVAGFAVEWTTTEGRTIRREFTMEQMEEAVRLEAAQQREVIRTRAEGGPGIASARMVAVAELSPEGAAERSAAEQKRWTFDAKVDEDAPF